MCHKKKEKNRTKFKQNACLVGVNLVDRREIATVSHGSSTTEPKRDFEASASSGNSRERHRAQRKSRGMPGVPDA